MRVLTPQLIVRYRYSALRPAHPALSATPTHERSGRCRGVLGLRNAMGKACSPSASLQLLPQPSTKPAGPPTQKNCPVDLLCSRRPWPGVASAAVCFRPGVVGCSLTSAYSGNPTITRGAKRAREELQLACAGAESGYVSFAQAPTTAPSSLAPAMTLTDSPRLGAEKQQQWRSRLHVEFDQIQSLNTLCC